MPWINKKKCIACKKCVRKCPVDAISMVRGTALINDNECIYCGKCVRICPVEAILKDKEHIDFEIKSGIKKIRKSLAKSGNKKKQRRMVRSKVIQLRMQRKVIEGTLKELKHLK
ncbi:putative ferredoxin [Methanolobus psychrophilus R15]|nr:putative ferredoxin [Methanolobus psychrophilus R15]